MGRAAIGLLAKRRSFVAEERLKAEIENRPFPSAEAFRRYSSNPTYRSWKNGQPKSRRAVPVLVCQEWADRQLGFERFVIDMGERPDGAEAQIVDPSKAWGPGNVRWGDTLRGTRAGSGWSGVDPHLIEERRKAVDYMVDQDRTGKLSEYRSQGLFERRLSNPIYSLWTGIRGRCYRRTTNGYMSYGGRGIRLHEDWELDFETFARDTLLRIGPSPSPSYSIDRIDPNGDYEPESLRWATRSQQARNKRQGPSDPEADEARFMAKERARWARLGVEVDAEGFLDPDIGADGSKLPEGVVLVVVTEASEL